MHSVKRARGSGSGEAGVNKAEGERAMAWVEDGCEVAGDR